MFDHGMPGAAILVADQTRNLFQFVCAIMVFFAVPVLMLTPIFAWQDRSANTKRTYRRQWDSMGRLRA